MHRCLLVTDKDVFEFVLLVDRVVNVEYSATGVTKDVFHALIRQATHDDVCAI